MKKVYITGSSYGLGEEIHSFFLGKGYEIHGLSRSQTLKKHSYQIDLSERERALDSIVQCDPDIFVNNAHSSFNQLYLITELAKIWNNPKVIINISSNVSDFSAYERETFQYATYDTEKFALDFQVKKIQFANPHLKIINLRPGLFDSPRVSKIKGPKMDRKRIIEVIATCLTLLDKGIYVQEMTFSHVEQFYQK